MPYIVARATETAGPSTDFSMAIPAGHQSDDVLVALIAQDGGSSTITASGWTQIGTQAAAQAQRTTSFWKLATSSSEPDLALTGTNDEWVVTIIVIRGANTAAPIHQNDRTNSVNSTTAFLDSGTVTTTQDGCLLLYAWGFDSTSKLVVEDQNSLVNIGLGNSAGNCMISGYRHLLSAGTSPVLRALSEVASEGGSALVIAVADADPSNPQFGPFCDSTYSIICRYGGVTDAAAAVPAFTRHDGITWNSATTLAAATINGLTVMDIATFTQVTYQPVVSPWGGSTGLSCAGSAIDNTGRWVGATHAIPTLDMRSKIFSVQFNLSFVAFSRTGPQGCIVVFQDSSNRWVAFQLSRASGMIAAVEYTAFIDLENATPLDQSGSAIDWSAINRIGYLQHKRTTSTTANIMRVRNALLCDRATLLDGSAAAPVSSAFLFQALEGWGAYLVAGLQGSGQALAKYGVRFGNGARKTYVDAAATSMEFPLRPTGDITRRFWNVLEYNPAARVVVLASADDVVNFQSSILVTDVAQDFIIDAGSSPSAQYDFAAASIVGWRVTANVAGITINDATFRRCRGIELNGCRLQGCSILQTVAPAAVTTDDPQNIVDCLFESAGTGHAIEITATGSYVLEDLRYEGYGADDSTDAAVYNNSGGAVTITTLRGDVPTIRNGTGATTTLITSPVTSSVQVRDAVTELPIENARVFVYAADASGPLPYQEAVSITRSGSVATVAHTAHGLANGKKVFIRGADQQEYNGVFVIAVNSPDEYTYTVGGTPASPATGSPTATGVVLEGLTDVNGEISDVASFLADQPVTGRARKSSASPFFQTAVIGGIVDSASGLTATVVLISDEG